MADDVLWRRGVSRQLGSGAPLTSACSGSTYCTSGTPFSVRKKFEDCDASGKNYIELYNNGIWFHTLSRHFSII